jgi:hypothetical protein
MKVGFHEIAPGVRMSFDDEKRIIIIDELKNPIPGFHGYWEETVIFTDEQSWNQSRFPTQANKYYSEMAMWFWIDILSQTEV